MPVVSRRPNKQQGPSGLDKFLQTISVATQVGGRVADFIQNKNQLELTARNTDVQERNVALQEGNAADIDASRILAMGLNAGEAARNANLATLAAQGQAVDPRLALAAITLGDIPDPTMRQKTREALAHLLDSDPSEIGDLFMLSPDTIASEAERDISGALQNIRDFRGITAQGALGPAGDAAARLGETGELARVPGVQAGSLARTEAMQNEANELLRVHLDPETGEYRLDGAMLNNPLPALDNVLTMLGAPTPLREFSPSAMGLRGPNLVVAGPMWETLTENALRALYESDENARQTLRDSAQEVADRLNIPFADALAAVEGRYGDMTVGNKRLMEQFQTVNRGVIELMGGMDPMSRQLIQLGQLASAPGPEGMGLPADQVLDAMRAFADRINAANPSAPTIKNVGVLMNMINGLFGGPQGFQIAPGTGSVLAPQQGALTGQGMRGRGLAQQAAAGGAPDQAAAPEVDPVLSEAWNRTIAQLAETLRAIPDPEQRRAAAQSYIGLATATNPADGQMLYLPIDAQLIEAILSQIP